MPADLAAYFHYAGQHALCNAPHLRTWLFLQDRYPQKWIGPLIGLLLKIKEKVETVQGQQQSQLSQRQHTSFFSQSDRLIQRGLRANPPPATTDRKPGQRGRLKQSPARNLLLRLKEHRLAVLAFMTDFRVPFDNNQSERDLRMMTPAPDAGAGEVKQKVSGCFRSPAGADIFCQIRGYLSTARKNGQMALQSLRRAFSGNPYWPTFVTPLAE